MKMNDLPKLEKKTLPKIYVCNEAWLIKHSLFLMVLQNTNLVRNVNLKYTEK